MYLYLKLKYLKTFPFIVEHPVSYLPWLSLSISTAGTSLEIEPSRIM